MHVLVFYWQRLQWKFASWDFVAFYMPSETTHNPDFLFCLVFTAIRLGFLSLPQCLPSPKQSVTASVSLPYYKAVRYWTNYFSYCNPKSLCPCPERVNDLSYLWKQGKNGIISQGNDWMPNLVRHSTLLCVHIHFSVSCNFNTTPGAWKFLPIKSYVIQ